jgi:hypothetical protein
VTSPATSTQDTQQGARKSTVRRIRRVVGSALAVGTIGTGVVLAVIGTLTGMQEIAFCLAAVILFYSATPDSA